MGNFIGVLVESLVMGLVGFFLFGLVYELLYGLVSNLLLGLLFGLFGGLYFERIPIIEARDSVKWSLFDYIQSVKKNLVLSLVIGFGGGLLYGFVVGLLNGLSIGLGIGLIIYLKEKNKSIIQINEPYQRFKASMKVLHFSILQHYHLRYLLSKKGLLPYKLVGFLNDMTKRKFLESDGATWRFRHRLLQDYFAAKTF